MIDVRILPSEEELHYGPHVGGSPAERARMCVDDLPTAGQPGAWVVVRATSDIEAVLVMEHLEGSMQRAITGARLVGGAVEAWTVQHVLADGDGWRLLIRRAQVSVRERG